MSGFLDRIDGLAAVSLDELQRDAQLLTRTDRKHLLTREELDRLLDGLAPEPSVLAIDGRRTFRYSSFYFDTAADESYLGAARARPHRFKVRTRTYLDTGECWIEVKLRDGRGRTVKHRQEHDADAGDRLTGAAREFLDGFALLDGVVDRLVPVLATSYRRTTLAGDGTRATVDIDLRCTTPDGRAAALPGAAIVETKSAHGSSTIDRALWAMGIRPATFSKFGAGTAVLRPELPRNKWRRSLDRYAWSVDGPPSPPLRSALPAASQAQARRCTPARRERGDGLPALGRAAAS